MTLQLFIPPASALRAFRPSAGSLSHNDALFGAGVTGSSGRTFKGPDRRLFTRRSVNGSLPETGCTESLDPVFFSATDSVRTGRVRRLLVDVGGLSEGESVRSVLSHRYVALTGPLRGTRSTFELAGRDFPAVLIKTILSDIRIAEPAGGNGEACPTRVAFAKGEIIDTSGYIGAREYCALGPRESMRTCYGPISRNCAQNSSDVACFAKVGDTCAENSRRVTCHGRVRKCASRNSRDIVCDDAESCASGGSLNVTCGNRGNGGESFDLALYVDRCPYERTGSGGLLCIGTEEGTGAESFCPGEVFMAQEVIASAEQTGDSCRGGGRSTGAATTPGTGSSTAPATSDGSRATPRSTQAGMHCEDTDVGRVMGVGVGGMLIGILITLLTGGGAYGCRRRWKRGRGGMVWLREYDTTVTPPPQPYEVPCDRPPVGGGALPDSPEGDRPLSEEEEAIYDEIDP
ncbi:MAG: hypothetical protein OXF02_02220 [Simkaniaceae bacterium]|nr:hypothetical protein [Simkaniaceae bacterium]